MVLVKTERPDEANTALKMYDSEGREARDLHEDEVQASRSSPGYNRGTTHVEPAGPSENDIVIAVMGLTGAGKSTFISLLADQPVQVGHDLVSCTVDIGIYSFAYDENRTVYIIDTPGFDDTTRPDVEILQDIAAFLATIYSKNVRLAGIIYLHRITDPRMSGSNLKNLHMLQKLCGRRGFPAVVLATTMWARLEATEEGSETGRRREQQLQKPEFWGTMLQHGSRIARHDGSLESARSMVSHLVQRDVGTALDIQVQMVDQGKSLDQTDAGQYLQQEFRQAREKLQRELAEYQECMEQALAEKDAETAACLKQEKEAAEAQAAQSEANHSKLNVSFRELVGQKATQYRAMAAKLTGSAPPATAQDALLASQLEALQSELRDVRTELQQMQALETSRRHEVQRQTMLNEYQKEAAGQHRQAMAQQKKLALLQRKAELDRQHAEYLRRDAKRLQRGGPLAFLKNIFISPFDDEEELYERGHASERRHGEERRRSHRR